MIESKTISCGVAEFLTRKLRRLPKTLLSALHVLTIFGSSVPMQVLTHVKDVCGNSNVSAALDHAVEEGLVKKTSNAYSFVHDMIQQSVQSSLRPDEKAIMLKEIAETLLARTPDDRADSILFILVNLINEIGPEGSSTGVQRMHYANLNLIAGEKV